jgi:hypothetical protein
LLEGFKPSSNLAADALKGFAGGASFARSTSGEPLGGQDEILDWRGSVAGTVLGGVHRGDGRVGGGAGLATMTTARTRAGLFWLRQDTNGATMPDAKVTVSVKDPRRCGDAPTLWAPTRFRLRQGVDYNDVEVTCDKEGFRQARRCGVRSADARSKIPVETECTVARRQIGAAASYESAVRAAFCGAAMVAGFFPFNVRACFRRRP